MVTSSGGLVDATNIEAATTAAAGENDGNLKKQCNNFFTTDLNNKPPGGRPQTSGNPRHQSAFGRLS